MRLPVFILFLLLSFSAGAQLQTINTATPGSTARQAYGISNANDVYINNRVDSLRDNPAAGLTNGDKGDVTLSGAPAGSAITIDNDAVSFSKFQNITSARMLGRTSLGSGDIQEITVSNGLTFGGLALKLGGTLTSGTNINAAGFAFGVSAAGDLSLSSVNTFQLSSATGLYELTPIPLIDDSNSSVLGIDTLTGALGRRTVASLPFASTDYVDAAVAAGRLADGDMGDATVSDTGTTLTLDADINKAWTGTHSFSDASFSLLDNVDPTKIAQFQASGITAATTRTYTLPNASGTIPLGTGVANYVPYWSGTNTLTGSSAMTFDGARLKLYHSSSALSVSSGGDPNMLLTASISIRNNKTNIISAENAGGTLNRWNISELGTQSLAGEHIKSSGSSTFISYSTGPVINTTGSFAGAIYGYYYSPTLTSTTGVTGIRAWQHNAGFQVWNSFLSPAQITSNQNDYDPTGWVGGGAPAGASVIRLSSDASRDITSVAGGTAGRIAFFVNVGTQNIVLKNDDGATGTAANRFAIPADRTLLPKQTVIGIYDGVSSRWRIVE